MAYQVILPRRAVKQPSPAIVKGGDCGACCIAGLLGVSVQEAYDMQDPDERPKHLKDQPVSFGHRSMSYTLSWRTDGRVDAVLYDVPFWPATVHEANGNFGFLARDASIQWTKYVRMGLQAGYYGMCSISFAGKGPNELHDHWVMLCGVREERVPNKRVKGAMDIKTQFLISCSAKSPEGYWLNLSDLFRKYGGYNIILVKPNDPTDATE